MGIGLMMKDKQEMRIVKKAFGNEKIQNHNKLQQITKYFIQSSFVLFYPSLLI